MGEAGGGNMIKIDYVKFSKINIKLCCCLGHRIRKAHGARRSLATVSFCSLPGPSRAQ